MNQACSNKQKGQGLLEYVALTALVAIVSISAVKTLGSKVRQHITKVTNSFDRSMKSSARSISPHDDATEEDTHNNQNSTRS